MSTDFLFVTAPFFLVRTPLFPIEEFYKLTVVEDLESHLDLLFHSHPELREAIAIASPSLYETLIKLDKREKRQAISSLFKYVVRMATRATPFGLFSCVTFGFWDRETSINLDLTQLKRRARPDMEWMMKVIDLILSDKSLLPSLIITRNPLLIEQRGRIILPYTRKKEAEKKSLSVRATPLVNLILEKTRNPISVHKLVTFLTSTNPILESEKILTVIENLMKEEIIFSSLLPTLLSPYPFKDFITNLEILFPSSIFIPKLHQLLALLDQYNQNGGDLFFKKIEQKMAEIISAPTFLQVDAAYPQNVQLSKNILPTLQQAAEVLWKLTCSSTTSALHDYHLKFLEKYGTSRKIPLLELLDEDRGIGIPDIYQSASSFDGSKEKHQEKWNTWLTEEWSRCLMENKKEIIISEAIIDHLFSSEIEKWDAPVSFDLYCELIASSDRALDQGDFIVLIHPTTGAGNGGATFGRFLDMFEKQEQNVFQNFIKDEEKIESNLIFAECSYFPSSPKSANVAIHTNLRSWKLDLGYRRPDNNLLSLDEILIGATEKRLFCTLRGEEKELIITSMNVLNPISGPVPVRFLRDVSRDRYRCLNPFSLGKWQVAPYFPRVRYKKAIFSPATWCLTLSLLEASDNDSLDVLINKISLWGDRWNLPRFLLLVFADHRIMLDRTIPFHLKEIAHQLKVNPNTPIFLTEKIGENELIKSNLGTHRSEFVIPFIKNKKYVAQNGISISKEVSISHSSRWKFPGSEWIYAKIYISNEQIQNFLTQILPTFIENTQELLDKWFFVRYQDKDGPHIRLRLKIQDLKNYGMLLQKLNQWISLLSEQGWIKEMNLASYEREVERYGGENIIELAEAFFCSDSQVTLSLLNLINLKKTSLPDYIIASLSLIDLLKESGLSLFDQVEFFKRMNLDRKNLEGFREWKAKLLVYARNLFQAENSSTSFVSEINLLEVFFKIRHSNLQAYLKAFRSLPSTTTLPKLLTSLLHMHCNRILGPNQSLELKTYMYSLQALSALALNRKESVTVETASKKIT